MARTTPAFPASMRAYLFGGSGSARMRWPMSARSIRTGTGSEAAFFSSALAFSFFSCSSFSSSLSGASGDGSLLGRTAT